MDEPRGLIIHLLSKALRSGAAGGKITEEKDESVREDIHSVQIIHLTRCRESDGAGKGGGEGQRLEKKIKNGTEGAMLRGFALGSCCNKDPRSWKEVCF